LNPENPDRALFRMSRFFRPDSTVTSARDRETRAVLRSSVEPSNAVSPRRSQARSSMDTSTRET
jgi:hypothetical protein